MSNYAMQQFRKQMRDAAWVEYLIVVGFGIAYGVFLFLFL